MKILRIHILFFFCFSTMCVLQGRGQRIAPRDTVRVNEVLATIEAVYRDNPDSAIGLSRTILEFTHKELKQAKGKYKRRLLIFKKTALGNLATVYHERGDMEKVIPYYDQMFAIENELGDKKGMAATLYGIAGVYSGQGNIPKAIEYHSRALKIYENLKDNYGAALAFYSLGRIYGEMDDTVKQEEYYNRAYAMYQKINDGWGIALMKTSIGGIYLRRGNFDGALNYFRECLIIYSAGRMPDGSGGDKWGIANSLEAIGRVYDKKNEMDSALFYYKKALEIREETEYLIGMTLSYAEIGEIYLKQGKTDLAMQYARKALNTSQQLGFPRNISRAAKLLSSVTRVKGNYKEALEMFELFTRMRDSLQNDENKKASFRQQLSYDYEKKEALLKAKEERKLAVAREESARKNVMLWAGGGGLLLIMVFSVFMFNRFRITKKQKHIIELQQQETEKQKEIIEEKNKDITDSINYARNIQRAILPSAETIHRFFPQSFVLFKPRDIVSGDFYFLEQVKDRIILAVGDCTGHGVPGALVSVVCSNALSRVVKEFEITDPGEILNKTREMVIETFGRENKQVKDGMDISLCSMSFQVSSSESQNGNNQKPETAQLRWAGANNPLWYIENGILKEIAPDKQPVGFTDHVKPFTTHHVNLTTNATVFLFTDGYADQFGGEKGKKLKSSRMKEVFASFQHQSMSAQKKSLEDTFDQWKGNLEQIDDVCIMGVRL